MCLKERINHLLKLKAMASNNASNNVKHKVKGYSVAFSRTKNKWVVKFGNKTIMEDNFKECKKYCKNNPL